MLTRRLFFAGIAAAGALALSLSTTACSKPEPPTLVPKEAGVTSLGPAGATVLLRVEATNPNRIALSVRSVTAKAKLDNKWSLGTVTISQPVVLPPKAPTMVDVPMTLPWADMNTLTALAMSTGPVPYVLEGTATVGGENLNFDVPFTISGTITRDQIVGAALKSLPAIPAIPGLTAPPR